MIHKQPSISQWTRKWLDPELYALKEKGQLPGLEKIMNDTVLEGGKRLRPILMAEFAGLFQLSSEQILPFARAAELIHSATLAHDDVVDASLTRRGNDTLNARIENRKAVLGGDYLLAEGIFEVARQNNFQILESLSLTLKELATGELLQNECRGNINVSDQTLTHIHDLKTGSLFRWCCSVPVYLKGTSPETLRLSREFATRLGLAFQWIDDAIDFSIHSGKPLAQDLREGLLNKVSVKLLNLYPNTTDAVATILKNGLNTEPLPWSSEQIQIAQKEVQYEAKEKLKTARLFLKDLYNQILKENNSIQTNPSSESLVHLEWLIEQLESRKK